jgi:transposase
VPAGTAEAVRARLGDASGRLLVAEDPGLAPGDARAAWGAGEAVSDLAERRAAVAEVLAALGLGPAREAEGEAR